MSSYARFPRDRRPLVVDFESLEPTGPRKILKVVNQDPIISKILTLPNELILDIIDCGNVSTNIAIKPLFSLFFVPPIFSVKLILFVGYQ